MNSAVKCYRRGFAINNVEQVDILIFKNQAMQILHLKHCVYKIT